MSDAQPGAAAPLRLRRLVSWEANKVATIGTRLTSQRMTANERGDFAVLAALQEFGDLSQADIGRRLVLDRKDVNTIATRLERDGYVRRRTDLDDRRRKVLVPTPAGLAHLDRLQAHADEVQKSLLVGLTSAEQDELVRLLDLVHTAHGPQPA